MKPINSGGPAFPAHTPINPTGDAMRINHGMSLRDYFAGQALVGYNGKRFSPEKH